MRTQETKEQLKRVLKQIKRLSEYEYFVNYAFDKGSPITHSIYQECIIDDMRPNYLTFQSLNADLIVLCEITIPICDIEHIVFTEKGKWENTAIDTINIICKDYTVRLSGCKEAS